MLGRAGVHRFIVFLCGMSLWIQVGHPAAEELSDVIVATVSEELARCAVKETLQSFPVV